MNKNEFMKDLSKRLKYLPKEDREDAIAYYNEYFEEMNPEENEDVTPALGQPKDVAKEILSDVKDKHISKQKEEKNVRNAATITWLVILGFFSMPLTVPIGIVALAVVLVLIVCILVIIITFGCCSLAIALSGIAMFVLAFMAPGIMQALMAAGIGLLLLGIGLLWGLGTVLMTKNLFRAVGKIFRK